MTARRGGSRPCRGSPRRGSPCRWRVPRPPRHRGRTCSATRASRCPDPAGCPRAAPSARPCRTGPARLPAVRGPPSPGSRRRGRPRSTGPTCGPPRRARRTPGGRRRGRWRARRTGGPGAGGRGAGGRGNRRGCCSCAIGAPRFVRMTARLSVRLFRAAVPYGPPRVQAVRTRAMSTAMSSSAGAGARRASTVSSTASSGASVGRSRAARRRREVSMSSSRRSSSPSV